MSARAHRIMALKRALADHSEKGALFELLEVESRIGVGRVEGDQVEDYARRKGMTPAEVEGWLAPVLGYEPSAAAA